MKTLDLSKQLDDVEVKEQVYNRFVQNCLKSKTSTSWIYWNDPYQDLTTTNEGCSVRRKVYYDRENKLLIANAIWILLHFLWLYFGMRIHRFELPDKVQRRINIFMALSLLGVVALSVWSTLQ